MAMHLRARLTTFAACDWVSTVESTNGKLLAAARDGEVSMHGPRLLGAHHQTQGQGRLGRPWFDLPGQALMFSCGFVCATKDAASLTALGPALGASSVGALSGFLQDPGVLRVKWPNDLMLGSGKVAGLLAQTIIRGQDMHLVIGMGLNLTGQAQLTQQLEREVAAIGVDLKPSTQAHDLVCSLALAWQTTLETLISHGFKAYHDSFGQYDYLAGHQVDVRDQERLVAQGQAQGVDADGRLLVLTDCELAAFDVGDVSVRLNTA